MRTLSFIVALESCLAVAACGGSSSSKPVDAGSDAPPTPGTLTLSGTVGEISASGLAAIGGVTLTAYNAGDDGALGTATSAADGTFSISVSTAVLDGYLKATTPASGGSTYKDSYLYPPATLTASYTGVPVFVLKASTYNAVNTLLLGNGQTAQSGWIALLVQDATGAPVAGATVSSDPKGQINYNASNLPSTSATATAADGIAYDTNITPGNVTVMATKTGASFAEHTIKVRPDVVTLTLIAP